ncbi:MAG: PIN domain-containing protein [Gammaproteobacteria bacterium]|nr:PIN domain-containing protein [Gammaproteobacteria bacterium]
MGLLVDTSVWSLALRRDQPKPTPEVLELKRALLAGDSIYGTGLILQELLQGFTKPKAHKQIVKHFSVLPFLVPDRSDHIEAAEVRNRCRRSGVQAGTIDALLAQLCIRHDLEMLTTDSDFRHISEIVPLQVWTL